MRPCECVYIVFGCLLLFLLLNVLVQHFATACSSRRHTAYDWIREVQLSYSRFTYVRCSPKLK